MSEHCVDVAFYWTPQQAQAIADYLEKLLESIWEIYGDEIDGQHSRPDLQTPLGNHRALDSSARHALNSIVQRLRRSDSASPSCPQQGPSSRSPHRTESSLLPVFDQLPSLSDENIGDVLNYLLAMVGTFEEHYAEPLRRLREKHFLEECDDSDERQLDLPMAQHDEIKF